jgi:hypothetical protein
MLQCSDGLSNKASIITRTHIDNMKLLLECILLLSHSSLFLRFYFYQCIYVGRSSQTGTFNFTVIKRDASVAVLHAVVSGKCVLLLIGGAHVTGQSRDR